MKIITSLKKCKYLLEGYSYRAIKELQNYEEKYTVTREQKAIMKNWPINGNYERIFGDIVASRKVLYSDFHFPNQLIRVGAVLNKKTYKKIVNNTEVAVPLSEIREVLKETKKLIIRDSNVAVKTKVHEIDWSGDNILLNGKEVDTAKLEHFFYELPREYIVYEKKDCATSLKLYTGLKNPVLRIAYLNLNGHGIKRFYYEEHDNLNTQMIYTSKQCDLPIDRSIGGTDEAINDFNQFLERYQDVRYINIAFRILDEGYELLQIDTGIDLIFVNDSNKCKDHFIQYKKRKEPVVRILNKYIFSYIAKKKGFLDYMYRYWLRSLYEDIKTHTCSIRKLIWANRRGFYSYRIEQYGLTNENYKEFLPDRVYKKMRPINSKYYKLLTDKLITYYLLSNNFKEFIPKYFGKIKFNGDEIKIYEIDDSGCFSWDSLVQILKKEKKLACKKIVGSHGDGFMKLEYFDDSRIIVNDEAIKMQTFKELLIGGKANYIVTEYVETHDNLRALCNNITSTIRIMTININNGNAIKDAYFKIATKKTGLTDNVAMGGIVAKVDMTTGKIYNPEILHNHKYIPCNVHPDNNKPIEGIVPHWELIVKKVNSISLFLSELEYLGFDIVVTNEGFKILEINTHQDLHKYSDYPNEVKEYFKVYL